MMSLKKLALTALLGSTTGPALACDLDGFGGGHRFIAFANMYRGPDEQLPPRPVSFDDGSPSKADDRSADRQPSKSPPANQTAEPTSEERREQHSEPGDPSADMATFR